jgi:uncharacterized protein with ATP-grasp and redox domains
MKTDVECLPCFLRQALQAARMSGCSEEERLVAVKTVAAMIPALNTAKCPPLNAGPIYKKLAEVTGCEDPFLHKKKESNTQALQILPDLRKEIRAADGELEAAIRFAIAGNIMDYGALESFDVPKMINQCREAVLVVDHLDRLVDIIKDLVEGSHILYLTDNCGEIVFDSLLVELLHRRGFKLTIATKGGPIINDALVEDAYAAGLDQFGEIITNGTRLPGTVLSECSPEFLEKYKNADLIISKGQGNFESLSEVSRDIYFLLTIKCAVAARHMEDLVGMASGAIGGNGEMAVYFSGE